MSIARDIDACEERLQAAMLAGDVPELDRLIGDDALYTDPNGRRIGKADDLALHETGLLRLTAIEAVGDRSTRLLDDVAIVCLTSRISGFYGGQAFEGVFAYTRLWRRRDGRWRVEAAHSTPVAPASG